MHATTLKSIAHTTLQCTVIHCSAKNMNSLMSPTYRIVMHFRTFANPGHPSETVKILSSQSQWVKFPPKLLVFLLITRSGDKLLKNNKKNFLTKGKQTIAIGKSPRQELREGPHHICILYSPAPFLLS